VKWIFIEPDAISPGHARAFFTDQGINFGWTTDDSDNSEGANTVIYSPLRTGTPWIGALRTDTMAFYANNLSSLASIQAAAEEIAGL
jgi:hypothetical protein